MVDVKTAVEQAVKYLGDLPTAAIGRPRSIALEEVELTDDERHWLITLSYREEMASGLVGSTKYKVFKIEASNGRVVAMKIREMR